MNTPSQTEPIKPQIVDEEKERLEFLNKPQVKLFIQYYTDKKEVETFGNRTKAYIKAYNLDPETQYASAKVLGSRLLTKVNFSAREYLENTGWGLPTLLELNKKKAIETNNSKYLDTLYELGEYKHAAAANNIQVNNYNMTDKAATDWNDTFLKFLESQ